MKRISWIVIPLMLFIGTPGCGPFPAITMGAQYQSPWWAPPHYAGVRYYYFPDLELYYDLSDGDFIYLDRGQWIFSPVLPSIYSYYDLGAGFVIGLNIGVFEPWMHHQYYLAHYPPYYYRNYYREQELGHIRGFNENVRRPYDRVDRDRDRTHNPPDRDRTDRDRDKNRNPQPPNYYGKEIGRPVKVTPQMRPPQKQKTVKRPTRGGGN